MKIIRYLLGLAKVRALTAAIVISLVVGYAARSLFSPAPVEVNVSATHQTTAKKDKAQQHWTCAMHPQIDLPKPGLCPICGMKLILRNTQEGEASSLRELTVSEDAKKLMDIQTVPVERQFVEAKVRMVGKIDYDETRLRYITAWVPGRLDRLYVDYTGVPVKKGDHMVSLYSPELLSGQEELLQAIEAVKNLKNSRSSIMLDMSKATVVAAEDKLRLWGLKPEQIAKIKQRGTTSDHITIYAPIGGIVIHKNAQEGMYVKTGTRIYTIADLSEVWVQLDAYESDLMWLRYGQTVKFTTEAYPGKRFTGTIAFIDPILTQTTRTVKVRINAANPTMILKPGMFVRAVAQAWLASGGKVMDPTLAGKRICPMHPGVVKDKPGTCDICQMPLVRTESLGYLGLNPTKADKPLVIPVSAALVTGTRAVVYVELPNRAKPTFEGRQVVLGPRAGNYYLVRNGLAEGERVVTNGNFKLDSELQIRAKPSMMTPEGGGGGKMTIKLPAAVKVQLRAVLSVGRQIDSAMELGDMDAVRSTFADLQRQLGGVDGAKLRGHAKMLWGEYSMLLSNDAVEGKEAKDIDTAKRVVGMMDKHMASVESKLGVMPQREHTATAPGNMEFQQQFSKVLAAYLAMQQALANDDAGKAATAARQMAKAVDAVKAGLLQGDNRAAWTQTATALNTILADNTGDGTIEPVRKEFALLSEEMVVAAKRFGAGAGPLYQFKCPMVFNNRGATWLQTDDKTHNPYLGAIMPRCGELMETISNAKTQGSDDE